MSVYIIAEAGINHNGSLVMAQRLAAAAKQAGADAVKYQTYVTDDICRKDNPEYAWLKHCELSYDDFRSLSAYCKQIGIDFMSTPDTVKDAEFLVKLGVEYMKIGSANANAEFLHRLRDDVLETLLPPIQVGEYFHRPWPMLLISAGMNCDTDNFPGFPLAALMHCVSSYPCPLEQANMAVVDGFQKHGLAKFNGFSDHTIGNLCAIMAVARGARFIEKHFTLDRSLTGPDHHMSMEPRQLADYVGVIRLAEQALGDGIRRVMPCEQKTIEQLKARK